MATIKTDEKEVQVPDGGIPYEAEEQLGVAFSCKQGICGSCKVEVLEGMENLEPKTEEEEAMGCTGNERLLCQAKIKSGTVKIKP